MTLYKAVADPALLCFSWDQQRKFRLEDKAWDYRYKRCECVERIEGKRNSKTTSDYDPEVEEMVDYMPKKGLIEYDFNVTEQALRLLLYVDDASNS